jgi:hypothetical protein
VLVLHASSAQVAILAAVTSVTVALLAFPLGTRSSTGASGRR